MAKATFVKKARNDIPNTDIKKGESYYWWKFRHGGKHCSKKAPRPSQLTQSSFKSTLYGIQEDAGDHPVTDPSELESSIEDIKSQLEELRDECQSSLDNMPEGLQQGDSGQMLQTRIDSIEGAISDMENIDTEIDMGDKPSDESEDDFKKRWAEERWDEVTDALGSIDEG